MKSATKNMSFNTYSRSAQKKAPQAVRLMEMSDEMRQKLVISGVSLVPQAVVFLVFAFVLYLNRRGPILRNGYFDLILWLGLFALSFGVNFGSMFIQWPGIDAEAPAAQSYETATQTI